MLIELGEKAIQRFPLIQFKITHANEVQDLWYLRGEIMTAIATFEGELVAHEKIMKINQSFAGLIPQSWFTKRNSPLYYASGLNAPRIT